MEIDLMDNSFELFHNSEGQRKIFSNMVNYPSEVVHNEVFSNQDGETNKIDSQKVADTVTSVGSAVGSIVGTFQAFQDPSKKEARKERREEKRSLREVCGMKPLLKKNRAKYDQCVSNYNAQQASSSASIRNTSTAPDTSNAPVPAPTSGNNKKVLIYVGVGAVVLIAGYLLYKKKFAKK